MTIARENDGFGIPDEVALMPLPTISETYTLTCSGVSLPFNTIHWFAGFVSLHGGGADFCGFAEEFDDNRGGFAITNWQTGTDDVIARKVYNRSCESDETTFSEKTVIELLQNTSTSLAQSKRP